MMFCPPTYLREIIPGSVLKTWLQFSPKILNTVVPDGPKNDGGFFSRYFPFSTNNLVPPGGKLNPIRSRNWQLKSVSNLETKIRSLLACRTISEIWCTKWKWQSFLTLLRQPHESHLEIRPFLSWLTILRPQKVEIWVQIFNLHTFYRTTPSAARHWSTNKSTWSSTHLTSTWPWCAQMFYIWFTVYGSNERLSQSTFWRRQVITSRTVRSTVRAAK